MINYTWAERHITCKVNLAAIQYVHDENKLKKYKYKLEQSDGTIKNDNPDTLETLSTQVCKLLEFVSKWNIG